MSPVNYKTVIGHVVWIKPSTAYDSFPLCFVQGECDPAFGSEFVFTVHSKELIVGDVFVRIYNEQPTFVLEV